VNDEITLEHDLDQVLGLMTADGAEGASLLDEAMPPVASAIAEPEDADGDGDGDEDLSDDD
jgi:hypothetical protein